MRSILKMTWSDVGATVRVRLDPDRAPNICTQIAKALPLRCITWHSVISGDNVGVPLPIVVCDFQNPQPRRTGTAFVYPNGQLAIIPYGPTTEPGDVNTFGEVLPEDLLNLAAVGHAVRERFRMRQDTAMFVDLELVNAEAW
jgi:hypothetical protein